MCVTREKRIASSTMLTAMLERERARSGGSEVVEAVSAGIRGKRALYYVFVRKLHHRMRILMIAPEPFFEPRGTPFSEFHRIRALTELGHDVDLVTYPFGEDVDAARACAIFRSLRPPFVHGVKIGPSLAKVPLDALLGADGARRARVRQCYDAIHSHEEGGVIGVVLAALLARAPSLRHALEPAAAAREFRVHAVNYRAAPVSGSRTADGPPLARRDCDLSLARGDRPGDTARCPRGAD